MNCCCCGTELPERPSITGHDRLAGVPGEATVHICGTCGSGRTAPVVPEEEFGVFYPDDYIPHVAAAQRGGFLGRIERFVSGVLRTKAMRAYPFSAVADERGRMLDAGCGRGDLGAAMIERGWEVTGIDPSPLACEVAASQGLKTVEGTLSTADLGDAQFDLITFQHSLEHVFDPSHDIEIVRRHLVPGGRVLISVPNFGCWQRKLFRGRWFHLDLPRHRHHYTAEGLRRLFDAAGFTVEESRTSSSPFGVTGSLTYVVAGRWFYSGPIGIRAITYGSFAVYPITWLLGKLLGGGDFLHAVVRLDVSDSDAA
jgi:2-polyprenyl-3-methyl-5-hydroxy-6-metoxy-1,4-benzoquinol methylase